MAAGRNHDSDLKDDRLAGFVWQGLALDFFESNINVREKKIARSSSMKYDIVI